MQLLFFALLLLAQLGMGVNATGILSERNLVRRLIPSSPPPPLFPPTTQHPELTNAHPHPTDKHRLPRRPRLQARQEGDHRGRHQLPTQARPARGDALPPGRRGLLLARELRGQGGHLRVQRRPGARQGRQPRRGRRPRAGHPRHRGLRVAPQHQQGRAGAGV